MQNRFFVWEEDTDEIFLLGYPLSLTPLERQIVRVVLELDYATRDDIVRESRLPMARGGISVHVHAINQKAFAISGRKLIASAAGGYAIYLQM